MRVLPGPVTVGKHLSLSGLLVFILIFTPNLLAQKFRWPLIADGAGWASLSWGSESLTPADTRQHMFPAFSALLYPVFI